MADIHKRLDLEPLHRPDRELFAWRAAPASGPEALWKVAGRIVGGICLAAVLYLGIWSFRDASSGVPGDALEKVLIKVADTEPVRRMEIAERRPAPRPLPLETSAIVRDITEPPPPPVSEPRTSEETGFLSRLLRSGGHLLAGLSGR
jgi:hypothetical protein